MIHPVIAIDGPSASGKGTVASVLAKKLNFVFVDTGAMYRAFAWAALEKNIDLTSREAVKNLIKETKFDTEIFEGKVVLKINSTDVAPFIREPRINQAVSPLAAIPEIREYLVNRQRQLRLLAPLIMEGRETILDTAKKLIASRAPAKRLAQLPQAVREVRKAYAMLAMDEHLPLPDAQRLFFLKMADGTGGKPCLTKGSPPGSTSKDF